MPPITCSAIVLAGGRSSRLGGRDKALEILSGRPLIAHVLERLRPQVDDIVINCNRHPEAFASFGHSLIRDESPDFLGPLAGIAAALPHCRHDRVLIVPCDTPYLPLNLYQQLAAAMHGSIKLVVAHDGERVQPLFMLLHRELLSCLGKSLAQGHCKVEQWCADQKPAIVRFNDMASFANLNTEEELNMARKNGGEKDSSAF